MRMELLAACFFKYHLTPDMNRPFVHDPLRAVLLIVVNTQLESSTCGYL